MICLLLHSTLSSRRGGGGDGSASPRFDRLATNEQANKAAHPERTQATAYLIDAFTMLLARPDLVHMYPLVTMACCDALVNTLGPTQPSITVPALAVGQALRIRAGIYSHAILPDDYDDVTLSLLSSLRLGAMQLLTASPTAAFQAQVGLPETYSRLCTHSVIFARQGINSTFLDYIKQIPQSLRIVILSAKPGMAAV